MRSGGFPGAELAGCSQSKSRALRLRISALLGMFSPSCKCLSHPWGDFFFYSFLPFVALNPDPGWAG